jgi:hypothetical protein
MNRRLTFLLASMAGVLLLIAAVSTLSAQRTPFNGQPMMGPMPGFGPAQGRFVVAFSSAARIVVLDSATGKLYQARESDFLDIANLPKLDQPPPPPQRDERGKARPKAKEERKDELELRRQEERKNEREPRRPEDE